MASPRPARRPGSLGVRHGWQGGDSSLSGSDGIHRGILSLQKSLSQQEDDSEEFLQHLSKGLALLKSQDTVTDLYQSLSESDQAVLMIKFETMVLDVVGTLNSINDEANLLRRNLSIEKQEKNDQIRRLEEEVELSVVRAEAEARKDERRRSEREKRELKESLETEIDLLRDSVKKLQDVEHRPFLHSSPSRRDDDDDVDRLRVRVDELSAENRTLRLNALHAETNEALLKSEVARLLMEVQERERELHRESQLHSSSAQEQEALRREMGALKNVNQRLHDANDELRETLVASPMQPRHSTHRGRGQTESGVVLGNGAAGAVSNPESDADPPRRGSLFEEMTIKAASAPAAATAPPSRSLGLSPESEVVADLLARDRALSDSDGVFRPNESNNNNNNNKGNETLLDGRANAINDVVDARVQDFVSNSCSNPNPNNYADSGFDDGPQGLADGVVVAAGTATAPRFDEELMSKLQRLQLGDEAPVSPTPHLDVSTDKEAEKTPSQRSSSLRRSIRRSLRWIAPSRSPGEMSSTPSSPRSEYQTPFFKTPFASFHNSFRSKRSSTLPASTSSPILLQPEMQQMQSQQRPALEVEDVQQDNVPDRMFKVVFAGDAAVGKSSFILRLCKGVFSSNTSSTLGVDFHMKTIRVQDKTTLLQLWDTAGQERFRSITRSYFRKADGVLLLYDISSLHSFLSVRDWIQTIEEDSLQKVPVILCGNKADLRESLSAWGKTAVSFQDGERLAQECEAIFVETSAKSGAGVEEALRHLVALMRANEDMRVKTSGIQLQSDGESVKRDRCCGVGKWNGGRKGET